MKTKLIKQTPTTAEITVTLDAGDLKPHFASVMNQLRAETKIAGFRPGKAPDELVERAVGQTRVHHDVLDAALDSSYRAAIEDMALEVIARPELKLTKFVPPTELEYDAIVLIMPEVKLPSYQTIHIKQPEVKIEAKEVGEAIETLRRRQSESKIVLRAAKTGDEVKVDFDGTKDGQPVPGTSAQNYVLRLGEGGFIPGFTEQINGMAPGTDKTFDITFPADYDRSNLASQTITFKVKVHEVREIVLPLVDDKFATAAAGFKTAAELRADLERHLTQAKAEKAEEEYEKLVLDQLVAKSKLEVPTVLVEQRLGALRQEVEQNLAYSGLDLDRYLSLEQKTAEQFETELKPEAERRTKLALILAAVAKAEDIKVTVEEVDAQVAALRASYTDPEMRKTLSGDQIHLDVLNHLLASKTVAKLVEYAKQ